MKGFVGFETENIDAEDNSGIRGPKSCRILYLGVCFQTKEPSYSNTKSLADFYADFSDSEEQDDTDNDPDWRKTPLMKRIQKMRVSGWRVK